MRISRSLAPEASRIVHAERRGRSALDTRIGRALVLTVQFDVTTIDKDARHWLLTKASSYLPFSLGICFCTIFFIFYTMSDRNELDDLVGERVRVIMMDDTEIAGEVDSYTDNFGFTLTGDGDPDPDDIRKGDIQIEFVDGKRILNGSNVKSVEPWDRPYADEN